MRKIIIVLASIVTVFLLAAAVIPMVFEDDIRESFEKALDDKLDASVYYDLSGFGLTLFKNFPNPTASLQNFGIVGIGDFEGDTLISVRSFDITLDLLSIFSDNYSIKSVNLVQPRLKLLTLNNGKSNYEIVNEGPSESEDSTNSDADFQLAINQWNINEGQIVYHDKSSGIYLQLKDITHIGGGTLTLQQYDLSTNTTVKEAYCVFEGTNYLSGQSLFADADLSIDLENYIFSFKNNQAVINDFPLSFSGSVRMPTDDIDLDLTFASENSNVKSLYSLIPGVYTAEYENIVAQGEMAFSGSVNGIYNESSLPSFHVNLNVSDGMISYPDLPTAIDNINIDMLVDNKNGIVEQTLIEIRQFHVELGNNPINGSLLIRNLNDYSMKADVDASIDLAELISVFPIEDTQLRGQFKMNLKADGIYDSVRNKMPAFAGRMSLRDGYIKNGQFPKAIEEVSFSATADCPTGEMTTMEVDVEKFNMTMADQNLSGAFNLNDLVDYQWHFILNGGLDLQVLSEVYPIEGTNYKGIINSEIETKGKYSDVQASRYDQVLAQGSIALTDFNYESDDLPQGFTISEASMTIDPIQIVLESFKARSGGSDVAFSGRLSNYFEYIFDGDKMLKGQMQLNSNTLDLNEWITGDETSSDQVEDTVLLEVVELPRGVDFEFESAIGQIYYENLDLRQAKGLIAIKDGVLDLRGLSFNLLGGAVVMNGKYDSRVPDFPIFNYDLEVKSLSIPQAFTSFSTIQVFAPMAKVMEGDFSANFIISGMLKNDMSPVYQTLNGKGILEIAEATMVKSDLVSTISGYLKTGVDSESLKLKDVVIETSLENGRAHVKPFDISLGGQEASIAGSIGADGSLDYIVNTEIDAGVVGQKVNQLLAGIRGEDGAKASSKIALNFNVAGTYENPSISLAGTSGASSASTPLVVDTKDELKKQAESGVKELKNTAQEKVQDETKQLVEKTEDQLQEQLDTLKKEITKNLSQEAKEILDDKMDSTTIELQQTIRNLFKKKKN